MSSNARAELHYYAFFLQYFSACWTFWRGRDISRIIAVILLSVTCPVLCRFMTSLHNNLSRSITCNVICNSSDRPFGLWFLTVGSLTCYHSSIHWGDFFYLPFLDARRLREAEVHLEQELHQPNIYHRARAVLYNTYKVVPTVPPHCLLIQQIYSLYHKSLTVLHLCFSDLGAFAASEMRTQCDLPTSRKVNYVHRRPSWDRPSWTLFSPNSIWTVHGRFPWRQEREVT